MAKQHLEADFDPDLHPRGPDGKFVEVAGVFDEITDLTNRVKDGEIRDSKARREMEKLARDQTGVNVSLRTLPDETEKAARITQELIRISETEDLSGLDEFRVDSMDNDLKGLQAIASGRYKIRDRKVVINPDQFEDEIVEEWNENGHTVGDTPEATVKHEIGHYLHGENTAPIDPDSDVHWEDITGDLSEEQTERIQDELGNYAATMPGEFVAEAYVYQKEGNELSDELQELYDEWNGPEVQ